MDFSEEWKSLWRISAVFSPPLLHSSKPTTGPLFFNPIPLTRTHLFTIPLLSIFPPLPSLSLSTFLLTSSPDSYFPPSLASSLSSSFSPEDNFPDLSRTFSHNSIQLLHCQDNTVLVFFPTGENSDRIGFLQLLIGGSGLVVRDADDDGFGGFFVARDKLKQRIVKILVNPVAISSIGCNPDGDCDFTVVGYLFAFTLYSMHWFCVRINGFGESNLGKPTVVYLGSKVFKSCAIVNACWSPHLPEESVVLLESGDLFLFNLNSNLKPLSSTTDLKGTRLRVKWHDLENESKWVGCKFSWHPRILIVLRTDALILVDLRLDESSVNCLMKIDMLGSSSSIQKDRFVSFSQADFGGGFLFAVASENLLILCDVRKPLVPVLQWNHGLNNPCHIDVLRLSEMRSNKMNDDFKWASERGSCIILGSLWNDEFSLFFFGPSLMATKGSLASKISEFSNSLYAWELPSELLLSGDECRCGSCCVKQEFFKESLPEWISWQQKKEMVLGFGLLNRNLFKQLSDPDEFGGFMLIRLMSSGKLESQRYRAAWEFRNKFEGGHGESFSHAENRFSHPPGDGDYKFPRKFKYLKLEYLYASLGGDLAKVLISNMKNPDIVPPSDESLCLELHRNLCEKLKALKIDRSRSSLAVSSVLKDINLPTSVCEIAERSMWAGLPVYILQLGFSKSSELLARIDKNASVEFLVVPDQPQFPPFNLRKPSNRSNKWSAKVKRCNDLIGPVLPLLVLHTLHKVLENRSPYPEATKMLPFETARASTCDEIIRVAREMEVSDAVSLADDQEETWVGSQKSKSFHLHHVAAPLDSSPNVDPMQGNSDCDHEKYATLISKMPADDSGGRTERVGYEFFDDLSAVYLNFDSTEISFSAKEMNAYKMLKKQFQGFNSRFRVTPPFIA